MEQEALNNSFTYHAPKQDQPDRYVALRAKAKEFAELIILACPESRERSLSITKLEETCMWANKAIACNE